MVNPLSGSFLPKAERPFGEYELIGKLATGGMAEIFLARTKPRNAGENGENEASETTVSDLVVIKKVLPHLLEEQRFIAMFHDEARLASKIISPNVCRVIDSGRVGDTPFIAMEYLHGVPFSSLLLRSARTKQHLSVSLVVGILIQCCNGLHDAHELTSRDGRSLEVVHRDVSPPNIFITTDGLAKMLDFGVAKARGASQKTRTGTVKGKNSYMSPEQILGHEVDRRSDVFSLGIVLWEALTAKRLFSRETDFLTFTAITTTDIQDVREIRADLSDAHAEVVNKALSRDRDERYATAKEFALALWQANEGQEEYASEITIGEHLRQRFSKELLSLDDLSKSIAENFDASDDEEPGDDLSLSLSPAEKAPHIVAATQAEARIIGLAKTEDSIASRTNTHELILAHSRERRRLVLAVMMAVALTALAAFFLLGDSGSKTAANAEVPSPAGDAAPSAVASPVADDASVALALVADASASDAKAALVMPALDDRPAYLTVDSSPYATIYLDGKKLGVTPIFKLKLAPGKHKLRAVSATGAKQTLRLNLVPGRTKNLGRLKW